jgi:hypothetical protein
MAADANWAMTEKDPKGPDMRVQIAGVELQSPVIAASGTIAYGVEFEEIVSLNAIGAFVTNGLSREPMAGNASPRFVEAAAGLMNGVGLQNMGASIRRGEDAEAAQHSGSGGDRECVRVQDRGLHRGDPGTERHAGDRHV